MIPELSFTLLYILKDDIDKLNLALSERHHLALSFATG